MLQYATDTTDTSTHIAWAVILTEVEADAEAQTEMQIQMPGGGFGASPRLTCTHRDWPGMASGGPEMTLPADPPLPFCVSCSCFQAGSKPKGAA